MVNCSFGAFDGLVCARFDSFGSASELSGRNLRCLRIAYSVIVFGEGRPRLLSRVCGPILFIANHNLAV
jgi:hypothetical protein